MPIPDLGRTLRPGLAFLDPVLEVRVTPALVQVDQDGSRWCWAACLECVRRALDRPESQPQIAANAIPWNLSQCRLSPPHPGCNQGRTESQVVELWRELGFAQASFGPWVPDTSQSADVMRLAADLRKGPVQALLVRHVDGETEVGRKKHVVLIDGLTRGPFGSVALRVMDPDREVYKEQDRWVGDLSELGRGRWWKTLVGLTFPPAVPPGGP